VPEVTGALRVGPQSAGAEPGPACYGKGGSEPTVTDANVIVGHLPPRLLGGEMQLDVEAAKAAVQKIGDALGLDVYQAAEGILDIVNENMAGALRLVSVQRGYDPRDFALVAFGGAGPMHANAVAKVMGSFPTSCAASSTSSDRRRAHGSSARESRRTRSMSRSTSTCATTVRGTRSRSRSTPRSSPATAR
jgi:N-methylhydantoinase A/oxoprolinase/acetone carboxylase beta subunit